MDLREFGDRVRDVRERRGLKQAEVAHALRITAQAVSKWERGENAPDIAVLAGLGRVLGVTTDWLLGRAAPEEDTFEATVFWSDLTRFAALCAGQSPAEVAARANAMFFPVTEAVLRYEGVPVKYLGDGFLAFFAGAGHRDRALQAARHALELVGPENLRIMLHAGPLYLGAIGHPAYRRPDIMGETVNTTFLALQAVTRRLAGGVAVSESVARGVRELPRPSETRRVKIRGAQAPLRLYLFGPRTGPASREEPKG